MPIVKRKIKESFVITLLYVILALHPSILNAGRGPGEAVFLPAQPAAALGRGGNSVASEGISFFGENPASPGRMGKLSLSFEYASIGGGLINPAFIIAVPTSFGVIGAASDYYGPTEPGGDETVAARTRAGGARELYPGFLVGASLFAAAHEVDGRGSSFLGIQIGSIVSFSSGVGGLKGPGLHQLNLGGALRIGGAFGDDGTSPDYDQVLAGYTLLFYRHSLFDLRLYNEAGSLWGIDRFFIKTGLELEYQKMVSFRTGLIAPRGYHGSGVTAGVGILFDVSDLRGSVDYAWAYNRDYGSTHSLGITVAFETPDSRPPLTKVTTNFSGFSPNSDAVQDYMVFYLGVRDESDIRGWRFQILDSRGRVIKEFRHHRRERKRRLYPGALARTLFERRESRVIPSGIIWDGIDENGKVFPDGEYYFTFTAWDAYDNITPARKGLFIIDTVKPEVSVTALKSRLNSVSGGVIEIEQKIRERNDDMVTVELMMENGETVRRYSWPAGEAPLRFLWNGLNDKGETVKHGRYAYRISVKDLSGNRVMREIKNLIIEPREYSVDIISSMDCYSPSSGSPLVFTALMGNTPVKGSWELRIADEGGRKVRVLQGQGAPSRIEWDGLTDGGRKAPDGRYLYSFHFLEKDGTAGESPVKPVTLDSTPPDVRLSPRRSLFSPDGDFHNDFVELSTGASSLSGIARWELNFYSGTGGLYYKKSGMDDVPPGILWGGRGFDGSLPFSMEKFSVELVVFDHAGNRRGSEKRDILTDIMAVPRRDILRITFADATEPDFFHSDRRLNSVLGRLAGVLADYPDYRIDIEAHTDFEGDDHHNLIVSEKKAKHVKDFLAGKGMGEREIYFRGMGETNPLFGEDAGSDRGKNNRVEIILSPRAY